MPAWLKQARSPLFGAFQPYNAKPISKKSQKMGTFVNERLPACKMIFNAYTFFLKGNDCRSQMLMNKKLQKHRLSPCGLDMWQLVMVFFLLPGGR